jgi:hypothetical protein
VGMVSELPGFPAGIITATARRIQRACSSVLGRTRT